MFDGRRKFDICVAPSRKRSGMEINMKDNRDGDVEELAEELESRLTQKEEDDFEEILLEDTREELWLEDTQEINPGGQGRLGKASDRHRRKNIPEEELLEEDWEDEGAASMNPWMMAAAMAGLIILAAIICAVLWHFTHLKGDGDPESSQISASTESSGADLRPETDAFALDTPNSGESLTDVPASVTAEPPESPESTAAPSPTPTVLPSAVPSTSPLPSASPGNQASNAVQEPISGTVAMDFVQDNADVTPKDVINLRSEPSTLNADNIVAQAKNGEVLSRTGVNEATGWTKLEYNGEILYGVSQYLTTDLTYKTPVQAANPNRVNTIDGRVILFTDCSDNVTPKEYVNLRTEPSTSEGESTVRCQISNGESIHRTGYSPDAGWSRVEYNGEVLYVVSSYVYTVE